MSTSDDHLRIATHAVVERISQSEKGMLHLDKTLVNTADLASQWTVQDMITAAGATIDTAWNGWTIKWDHTQN